MKNRDEDAEGEGRTRKKRKGRERNGDDNFLPLFDSRSRVEGRAIDRLGG